MKINLLGKLKKTNSKGFTHVLLLMSFIVIFAIAGIAYLVLSHAAAGSNELTYEQTLYAGQSLNSGNGYTLAMQTDGNLVVYNPSGQATWATNTNAAGATNHLVMQNDGNLVLYNAYNTALWSSGTYGYGPSTLFMQEDGNLVIYKNSGTNNGGGPAIWAKNSGGIVQWKSGNSSIAGLNTNGTSCASVAGNSTSEGALLQEWSCTGSAGQTWDLDSVTNQGNYGRFYIVNALSGQCMDVPNDVTNDGQILQQWGCNGLPQQLWTLRPSYQGGYYNLVNVGTGKCLDITGGGTANGTKIQQWDCINNANQSWTGGSLSNAFAFATNAPAPTPIPSPPPAPTPNPNPPAPTAPAYNGPSGPVGDLVGCTSYAINTCSGTWFAIHGGPQMYYESNNTQGAVIPNYVYIDDTTPPCSPSLTYQAEDSCLKNLVQQAQASNPSAKIFVGVPDYVQGKSAISWRFPGNTTAMYEWYPYYTGSNTVPCGGQAYIVQRYFAGSVSVSPNAPQYSGFKTLWNQAAACNASATKVITWW